MSSYIGPDLLLAVVIAAQVGGGLYLLLERSLTRIALGVFMVGNGVNILFLVVGGPPGGPPLAGITDPADMADPVPQALVLTAIVIALAVTAFLSAMAYRSWQLNEHDEVQDDVEDRIIARMAAIQAEADAAHRGEQVDLDDEAADVRDETAKFGVGDWLFGDDE